MKRWALGLVLALAACGSVQSGGDDDPPDDLPGQPDAGIDGGGPADRPDARPLEPPTTALDVVPAAGRATGGGLTLDFQLGPPVHQAQGGDVTLGSGAAVIP